MAAGFPSGESVISQLVPNLDREEGGPPGTLTHRYHDLPREAGPHGMQEAGEEEKDLTPTPETPPEEQEVLAWEPLGAPRMPSRQFKGETWR